MIPNQAFHLILWVSRRPVFRWCARHSLLVGIMLAVAARITVWLVAAAYPIPNEAGAGISPLRAYSDIDLTFYLGSRDYYRVLIGNIIGAGSGIPLPTDVFNDNAYLAAPMFPLLLEILQFGPGNPLPASLTYLATGCALTGFWIWWLRRQGTEWFGITLFALLPVPFWFMLNISSDLPFAAAVAGFFFFYFVSERKGHLWIAFLFALLATATRPHGIMLIAFVLVVRVYDANPLRGWRGGVIFLALSGTLVGLGFVFSSYVQDFYSTGNAITYFGIPQQQYLDGIYGDLPISIDRALSGLSLLGAKTLYLTGLRPTWHSTPIYFVLIRAAGGMILFPGLIYLAAKGKPRHRLFVLIFVLPMIVGAAQERYLLAVIPILFFYGLLPWRASIDLVSRYVGGRERT